MEPDLCHFCYCVKVWLWDCMCSWSFLMFNQLEYYSETSIILELKLNLNMYYWKSHVSKCNRSCAISGCRSIRRKELLNCLKIQIKFFFFKFILWKKLQSTKSFIAEYQIYRLSGPFPSPVSTSLYKWFQNESYTICTLASQYKRPI